ncbi:MAG TPA: S9 family peptidase [Thermoanaerobaculia bacterium]|jgi:dipeptidyl aminopeptidase/acylaminoacyl peptidase
MRHWTKGLPLGVLLAVSATLAGETGRPLRFEEMVKLGRLGGFSVSSDGGRIAYAVGIPDVDANATRSQIWLVPAAGGAAAPRRLTDGEKDSDPRFSPDGRRLAFLSNRENGMQIWILDLSAGAPVRATSFPTGVDAFTWTPDGASFLIQSDVFPECTDTACLERMVKAREAAKVKGRIAERLLFRHWDSWKDGTRTHIWKVPAAASGAVAAVDLTPGNRDAPPFEIGGGGAWSASPDGKELVYPSNLDKLEALSTNADLFLTPLSGTGAAPARNLTAANPAFDGSPRFSPDGKWIAYRAQKRPGFESDRFRLMLLDRASGASRPLTEAFDAWVGEFRWAPDSKSLVFTAQMGGRESLYKVGITGGAPSILWKGGAIPGLEIAGGRIFFTASALTHPPEIWSVGLDGSSPSAVTHVNDARLAEIAMGETSERFTDSSDGKKLEAWVVKPPFFDPSRKYPAVFFIHGGPQGAWEDGWSTRWNPEVWAAYGYVVYAANPRGSTGFGQDFLDAISGDWGGQVYDDLMRQADDLASLPFVDRSRIGAAGASYGGYMINWIATHTQRFAVLVSHDGNYDLAGSNLETEELWFPTWELKGWPWNSDLYRKWSPSTYAQNLKTPMLVITSEKDFRVPFGQGLQLFTALQVQGVPSKLLTFPDEGHWVLKPGNSCLWHNTVMDWLHTYLGGAEADPKGLALAYSVTK